MKLKATCYNKEEPLSDETDQTQFILKDIGNTLHERLHTVCRHLPTDFEPYGKRVRTAADCSCGCQHFLKLPEPLGFDWGVCINPRSPRSGLLTLENQACPFFEAEASLHEPLRWILWLRVSKTQRFGASLWYQEQLLI